MKTADNKNIRIVVVGGVAGGASAAAKARRVNEQAEIIVLEKGPYVSFANCGLPYHLSGEITDRNELFVTTPERLRNRFNIDVRPYSEVMSIDRERRVVTVREQSTDREYEEHFDKLIIATGAEPLVPPISGVDARGAFTLKTIADMDSIIDFLDKETPKSAVVVGGGFIGLEAAEALYALGIDITVVEAAPQLLLPWDPDMADPVDRYMQDELMIDVFKNDPLEEILTRDGKVTGVRLKSRTQVEAGLVIVAVGVKPNTLLAKKAGLKLDPRNLILTDDHMRTSDPGIYAVGDAVQTIHRVSGQPTWLPLAGPANRQGRTAGANAAGGDEVFPGVIGTSVVRIGKICAARTGLNERESREAGLEYFTTTISGMSHAGYFPGARDLDIKLVVEKETGRLLGAQAVGRDGVDKRIDVLATAIVAKMTVSDIVDLELAYAPPFGSAKDPINMAGMVAENLLRGISESVTWEDHFSQKDVPRTIDVRTEEERKNVYIKGTELIPIDDLRNRLDDLDPEKPLRVFCRIGQRGYFAEQLLKSKGFRDVKNIAGGWRSIWGDLREDNLLGQEPEPTD